MVGGNLPGRDAHAERGDLRPDAGVRRSGARASMAATLLVLAVATLMATTLLGRRVARPWLIGASSVDLRQDGPDSARRRVLLRARARCSRSSGRRAAARPRFSAASPGSHAPRRGRVRLGRRDLDRHRDRRIDVPARHRRGRVRVPGVRAVPAPDRARQRDDGARPSAAGPSGAPARSTCSRSVHLEGTGRPPAVGAVGRRAPARRASRARWRASRACCCSTSRSRRSTAPCGGRSRRRSTRSAAPCRCRSSSSPTTSTTSSAWPPTSSSCAPAQPSPVDRSRR